MLDKIKDLGSQVANTATDTVDGITSSVKGGVQSLANTATSLTDVLNEKAVRASTAQMCRILEIAVEGIKGIIRLTRGIAHPGLIRYVALPLFKL